MERFLDELRILLEYIEGYSGSAWIALVALAICVFFLRALWVADKDAKPNTVYIVGVGVSALLFVSAVGLKEWHANRLKVTTPAQAFESLKTNKYVSWAIRLIPYSKQAEPSLSIFELKTLGAANLKYVFVGDYDELKNLSVREAVYRTGLSLSEKDAVSAIIFPIDNRELFPANARGVLRVIQEIDTQNAGKAGYRPFNISEILDPEARKQLETRHLPSWRWDAYSKYYGTFREAVELARREHVTALEMIGELGPDWHPAGYSQNENAKAVGNGNGQFVLKTSEKTEVVLQNFGARAFLIENLRIRDIDNVILINFGDLDQAKIPDFVVSQAVH